MEEFRHFFHNHPLTFNEVKSGVDKDVECVGCNQPINKLIDSFYSCSSTTASPSPDCISFFMHKTCFELPQQFLHPKLPGILLSLQRPLLKKQQCWECAVCKSYSQALCYSSTNEPMVCLKCVTSELRSLEDRNLCHPGHINDHPLTLVQRPSLFLCDACNTTATDQSYVCTKCSFCMHKSCANAPATYKCEFHDKHLLVLEYSLPREYHNFVRVCNICQKFMNPICWLYYCATCRFFAHVKCASATKMAISKNNNDEAGLEESVYFPAADESSLNDMMQRFIKAKLNDSDIVAPRDYINHWAHGDHQIALRKRNAISSHDIADEELLICNGCIKPISLGEGDYQFYECNSCNNFVMHTSCAQFPKDMQHNLAGTMVAQQKEPHNHFLCDGCQLPHNGICLSAADATVRFDIGCASLPTTIKHEAHDHPLKQFKCNPRDLFCIGCNLYRNDGAIYGCASCEVYMHMGCVLKPRSVNHKWDPHLLHLILSVGDVDDHRHEFECELCSEEINTNCWFYHCSDCDQSFHIVCMDPHSVVTPDYMPRTYTNFKFGATNICSVEHPHQHGLTFLLGKRKRLCDKCGKDTFCKSVLECSPCKFVVHASCDSYW